MIDALDILAIKLKNICFITSFFFQTLMNAFSQTALQTLNAQTQTDRTTAFAITVILKMELYAKVNYEDKLTLSL